MKQMKMTVIDMMNEIATKIEAIDNAAPGAEREMAIEDANLIAALSKNYFIGANLTIEKERLKAKFKTLDKSVLDDVVGTL